MPPDELIPAGMLEAIARQEEAARSIHWSFTPHAAQQEILDAPERFLTAAAGRRTGKSWIAGRWVVEEAVRTQGLCWWVAPTYAAAMRAWSDLLKNLPRKYRRVLRGERRIELTGGGAIEFKSADNPDALRGAGLAGLVVDEAAYVSEYVWQDVLQPMLLTTLGRVLAISTPRARKGWFYEQWRAGQRGAEESRSWQLPTSVNPYVPARELERLRAALPDSTYRREVLAEFLDELNAVFDGVREAATATRPPAAPAAAEYVLGVDWGRTNDFTVIAVLQVLGDGRARMVELVRFTGLRYRDQLARLRELVAVWQPGQMLAEQNSMGGPLVEQLQDEGYPLTGFTTTSSSKAPLIQQLQLAVRERGIELLNDPVLIDEFEDYEEELSDTGLPQFNAPPRQHDDTIIATALAWRLVAGEPGGDPVDGFRGSAETFMAGDNEAPAIEEGWYA